MRGRQTVQAGGGAVNIEINVAARNRRGAQLSVALALFVIVELAVFIRSAVAGVAHSVMVDSLDLLDTAVG